MSFKDKLRSLFYKPGEINISKGYTDGGENEKLKEISISFFAILAVIEHIAGLVSKCEFKTYDKNKEFKGCNWYLMNVKPNANQNATEFWQEAVSTLLYDGELLIVPVGDKLIIADVFNREEYAIREDYFSQVSRGTFTFDRGFLSSEVFYMKYGNSDIQALLRTIEARYAALFEEASEKYIKSGGQKGVIHVSALTAGDAKFEEKFAEFIKPRIDRFYKAKNAVLPLFQGYTYTPQNDAAGKRYTNEVSDLKAVFDDALCRAAQALKMPPQLIRGEVTGITEAVDYMLTACIDPLLNLISEEFSGKWHTREEVLAGSYIEADGTNIPHINIFKLAGNIDKLISSGFMSVNETREAAGKKPLEEEWADKPLITKNYQFIEEGNPDEGQ